MSWHLKNPERNPHAVSWRGKGLIRPLGLNSFFFFKGSRVCSRNQNLIIHSWCCSRCWWQRSAAANWFDFGEHPLKEISLAKGIKCVKGSWLQGERERPAWWCMPVMPVLGQPRASLSTSFPLPPLSLQLSVLPTECWGRGDWGIPGNG